MRCQIIVLANSRREPALSGHPPNTTAIPTAPGSSRCWANTRGHLISMTVRTARRHLSRGRTRTCDTGGRVVTRRQQALVGGCILVASAFLMAVPSGADAALYVALAALGAWSIKGKSAIPVIAAAAIYLLGAVTGLFSLHPLFSAPVVLAGIILAYLGARPVRGTIKKGG